MVLLGCLTKTEIDGLGYLVNRPNWLIDDTYVHLVPLMTTSSAERFTKEAAVAGIECNICA